MALLTAMEPLSATFLSQNSLSRYNKALLLIETQSKLGLSFLFKTPTLLMIRFLSKVASLQIQKTLSKMAILKTSIWEEDLGSTLTTSPVGGYKMDRSD